MCSVLCLFMTSHSTVVLDDSCGSRMLCFSPIKALGALSVFPLYQRYCTFQSSRAQATKHRVTTLSTQEPNSVLTRLIPHSQRVSNSLVYTTRKCLMSRFPFFFRQCTARKASHSSSLSLPSNLSRYTVPLLHSLIVLFNITLNV